MIDLHNVSQAALAEAADRNFTVHASWVHAHAPGMRVLDDETILLADCGLTCDTFNIICRARLDSDRAAQQIRAAVDFFTSVQRPFSWWVGPADQPTNLGDLLQDAGLECAESELAMAADLAQLQPLDARPDGLQVRRVCTATELADFARVVAANWTPPDHNVVRFYEQAAWLLLAPESPQWFYVGYLDDQPVAASEGTVASGVMGLYNVCTLSDYRQRGFGAALTLKPLLHAREEGYRTGVLQAAAGGVNIYRRIGFRQFGMISEYKPR